MAILQQQRQHQQGGVGGAGGGGGSKLSPSHLGGGLSKQPMVDHLSHPGMGGALSDLHAKTQSMYSGEFNRKNVPKPYHFKHTTPPTPHPHNFTSQTAAPFLHDVL